MSDWVRFHVELTRGAKRGVPRALRMVYMELSQQARRLRGIVVLPNGMSDVDGVCSVLGSITKEQRREVVAALETFGSPLPGEEEAMLRVETIAGQRCVRVTSWEKWNPAGDHTAARRSQDYRDRRRHVTDGSRHGDSSRDENRDVTAPVTVTSIPARDPSDLPLSDLVSPSEQDLLLTGHGGGEVAAAREAPSGVHRLPDPLTSHELGAAWAEGAREGARAPVPAPRGGPLRALLDAEGLLPPIASLEARCARLRAIGVEYGIANRGKPINPFRFVDWTTTRGTGGAGPPPSVHPAHRPADLSGLSRERWEAQQRRKAGGDAG